MLIQTQQAGSLLSAILVTVLHSDAPRIRTHRHHVMSCRDVDHSDVVEVNFVVETRKFVIRAQVAAKATINDAAATQVVVGVSGVKMIQ